MPKKVEKLTPYSDGKRRKMTMTKLTAVALTGRGANPEANVTFFKSHKGGTEVNKGGDLADLLTSEEDGHQHGIAVETYGNELYINVMYAKGPNSDSGHYHVLTRIDGGFVMSVNDGHTHTVDGSLISDALLNQLSKGEAVDTITKEQSELLTAVNLDGIIKTLENDMSKELEAKLAKAEAKLAKQAAAIANQTTVASFTATTKSFYDGLSETEQTAFVAKTDVERNVDIEAAKSADPVLYKSTTDGIEYRKSDGSVLIAMAKRMDAQELQLAKGAALAKHDALVKRASEDMGNLTGDQAAKLAVLGAIDTIEDEEARKGALAIIKAANSGTAVALETLGTVETTVASKAEDRLDAMVKTYATDKGVSVTNAYVKVMETQAGQDLYNEANS
jgi:hypothetical protein